MLSDGLTGVDHRAVARMLLPAAAVRGEIVLRSRERSRVASFRTSNLRTRPCCRPVSIRGSLWLFELGLQLTRAHVVRWVLQGHLAEVAGVRVPRGWCCVGDTREHSGSTPPLTGRPGRGGVSAVAAARCSAWRPGLAGLAPSRTLSAAPSSGCAGSVAASAGTGAVAALVSPDGCEAAGGASRGEEAGVAAAPLPAASCGMAGGAATESNCVPAAGAWVSSWARCSWSVCVSASGATPVRAAVPVRPNPR